MAKNIFHEKIAFGSFTNNVFVPFTGDIYNPLTDFEDSIPFKELVITNNLDKDIDVYDPRDLNEPITTIKATGGAFVVSKDDLTEFPTPPVLRNETGADATSGNVVYLIRR